MKNNYINLSIHCTKDGFEYEVGKLFKAFEGTLGECNKEEFESLYDDLNEHLHAIANILEKMDKTIEERQEAEQQAELAVREEVILDMEDGTKIKFNAPYGWSSKAWSGSTIHSFDLFDIRCEDGRITAAKTKLHWGSERSLEPADLEVCNLLLQRM